MLNSYQTQSIDSNLCKKRSDKKNTEWKKKPFAYYENGVSMKEHKK